MADGFGAVLLGVHTEKRGRQALWAQVRCGVCGRQFSGNVLTCPNWKDQPACPLCWARLNRLREQLGLLPWDTPPDAYPPEDWTAANKSYQEMSGG